MSANKPQRAPQQLPMFTGTTTSIISDATCLIERARKVQNQVVESVSLDAATFANVLQPLAHAENAMSAESQILGFYKIVSPNPDLRNASNKAQKLLDSFAIESAMREDLYRLVDVVQKKNEVLDPESHRFLVKKHKDYIRNGLKLPVGSERTRFKEIMRLQSQATLKFKKNLVDENGCIWFTQDELDGIPEDVLARLKKGMGHNSGKLQLTFKFPDLYPALRCAKNSETRKCIYIANENKCKENVPLFKDVILLRDEAARLLGYPNHAAFRLEDKMAKKPETVNHFLDDLRNRLTPGGWIEMEKLKQLKKVDVESRGEVFDDQFFLWDYGFYNRLMVETQYLVDQQKIAEYFPLQTTISSMLEMMQHLFGLVFTEISADDRDKLASSGKGSDFVWHEDVQIFSAWDDNEAETGFLGYLYLDLYSREGKYGNAANFNLCPGFLHENGTRHYPATALVCNFSTPTVKRPSLLKHEEVVVLFHELGHAIHDLVSRTIYSRFHGTNTVIDFGETPSQMLENWCWEPTVLKSLSWHYSSFSTDTSKSSEGQMEGGSKPAIKIPDKMIESLIRAKYVNSTLFNLRQLHLGIFDMMVHEPESHEILEKMDTSTEYNALRKDILKMAGPELLGQGNDWGHGQTNFGHLMGDYDAGYYGYLSSKAYSDDMFYIAFKEAPMNRKEGLRYRYSVLEKGGSQDEMKILIDFLGREPITKAFYKELGLVSTI